MAGSQCQAERPEQGAGRSLEQAEADRLASARVWQAKKAEAGYAAITWPTEFGGLGGSPIQSVIYSQEESNFEVPGGFFDIGLGMCIPTMMAWATKEQNERFVKPAFMAKKYGASYFPSRLPVLTLRAFAPRPNATVMTGLSTARRSGHRARIIAITALSSPARTRPRRSIRGSHFLPRHEVAGH